MGNLGFIQKVRVAALLAFFISAIGLGINIRSLSALDDSQFATNCTNMGGTFEGDSLDGGILCCFKDYCYLCYLDLKPPSCLKVVTLENSPVGSGIDQLLTSPTNIDYQKGQTKYKN